MAERIASGEIYVEVNDRDAIGRLNAVRSEYHRVMEAIDREEATATVDADLSKFDRKIKEAKAKVDKFANEEASIDLDADLKPLNRALARANKELSEFEKREPKANLDAKSARLKDELRIAKAALKQFSTEEAKARIEADDKPFIRKWKKAQALVKELDAQSAEVEVKLKGYEALRAHIKQLEKDIQGLHDRATKAAENREKAEAAVADAQRAREAASEAHTRKTEKAREKAARDRVAAEQALAADEKKVADQQIASDVANLRRMRDEAKLRDKYERDRDAMFGRDMRRAREEKNSLGGLMGQYGLLIKRLGDIADARKDAIGDHNKTIALDEKEMKIKRTLEQVTHRIQNIQRVTAEDDRSAAARKKELEEVPALELSYAKLNNKLDELSKKRRGAVRQRDQRLVYTIDIEADKVRSDIDKLGNELRRRTGRDPLIFNAEPRLSERAGDRIRRDFVETWRRGNWGSRASGAIMSPIISSIRGPIEEAADRTGRLYNNRLRRAINGGRGIRGNAADFGALVGGASLRGLEMFKRFGDGIASATVRLGPFTLTLRKALGAIALLSPVVVDVVGALGSLIGVVGSAAVGVGAAATAVIAGGVPALLGMGLVVKDVVQDFSAFKKAQKAYDDAVAKNGASSKQAAKKMTELNRITGGLSGTTQRQIKLAQGLGEAWDKATKPGRSSVWKAAGEGIATASRMMPLFAKNTNESLHQAERGWSGWMKALRSSEGQAVLSMNMDNFNRSIAATMRGLGHLAAYLGRVGAVAGRSLPGLAMTFNRWSKGLNDSTNNIPKFVGGIHGVINSMKAVGRTTMATGRFLKAFFGAGVKDGQSFADTMTNKLTDWTSKINADPSGLRDFFKESIQGAKSLYGFLAPIASTFVGWARALSPIARSFFDGAAAVGRFVQSIAEATAMKGPLQALAVTLGTLWAFGKIGAAASAIGRFVSALFGIGAASARTAAASNAAASATARQAEAAAAAGSADARLAGAAAAAATEEGRLAGAASAANGGLSRQVGAASAAAAAKERLAAAATSAAAAETRLAAATGAANLAATRGAAASGAAAAASGRAAAVAAANARTARAAAPVRATAPVAGRFGPALVAPRAIPPVIVPPAANKGVQALAKSGQVARRAITGLGAAVLGTTGLLGGAIVLTAAAGIALYAYSNRTRASEKNQRRMTDAQKAYIATAAGLTDGNIQLAQSTIQADQASSDLRATQKQANAEQREMNRLTKAGKQDSQAYQDVQAQHKQTLLGLRAARLNDLSVSRQVQTQTKQESQAIETATHKAGVAFKEAREGAANFAKERKNDLRMYEDIKAAAKGAGETVDEYAGHRGHDSKKAVEYGRQYEAMMRERKRTQDQYNQAVAVGVLQQGNLKRALGGLGPIAEQHARTFQSLGTKIQKALTATKPTKTQAFTFDDSKAAASAARSAAAISKGAGKAAGQKIVMRIIADSKSAEEAVRRLKAARIDNKKLKVIAEGGPKAVAQLERIAGIKLTKKEAKIVAAGGPAAEAIIAKVAGKRISDKVAKIIAKDQATAIVNAAKGVIASVRGKNVTVAANVQGTGAVQGLISAIGGVVGKTVNVIVNTIKKISGGNAAGTGFAMSASGSDPSYGDAVETPGTQRAQGRAADRAFNGLLPRMSTTQAQMGSRFQGPRAVWGEEPQYAETVISENPSYRKRNIAFVKGAAQRFGLKFAEDTEEPTAPTKKRRRGSSDEVEMSAGGKGKKFKPGPPASAKSLRSENKSTHKRITKRAWSTESAQPALNKVEESKKAVETQEFEIGRAEGKLKEPASFVKVVGTDSLGNDLVAPDQDAINNWTGQLENMRSMYDTLVSLIKTMMKAIADAEKDVARARDSAKGNINPLKAAIAREDDLIKGAKVKRAAKEQAKERKKVLVAQLASERKVRDSATDDLSKLSSDKEGLDERRILAEDDRQSYTDEKAAVQGSAASQAVSDSKSYNDNARDKAEGTGEYAPGGTYGPPAPRTVSEGMQDKMSDLDLESGLSDIGQGFKGQPVRTKEQINADRKAVGQGMIDRGNSLLTDDTTANDDEGRSLLGQGTGVLADIANSATSTPSTIQEAFNKASEYQKELYSQFGSNVISNGGTIADLMRGNTSPSNVMRGASGAEQGGNTYVTLQPSFKTQPSDPHLWSRDVAFELQAAL